MKKLRSYNVQIWVGLRSFYSNKHYSNKYYSLDDVRDICDSWVNDVKDCVTITQTEYRYVDGNEPGVIIGYIQYPRFPRKRKEIRRRAILLAHKLMIGLEQYRVTVTTPFRTYMISNRD